MGCGEGKGLGYPATEVFPGQWVVDTSSYEPPGYFEESPLFKGKEEEEDEGEGETTMSNPLAAAKLALSALARHLGGDGSVIWVERHRSFASPTPGGMVELDLSDLHRHDRFVRDAVARLMEKPGPAIKEERVRLALSLLSGDNSLAPLLDCLQEKGMVDEAIKELREKNERMRKASEKLRTAVNTWIFANGLDTMVGGEGADRLQEAWMEALHAETGRWPVPVLKRDLRSLFDG